MPGPVLLLRLTVAFMFCALPFTTRAASDPAIEIRAALAGEGLAGATWSLVENGNIRTGAAGSKQAQARTPLRADDRMHVGSVTKTLVALGLLRLASQGRIDLDAPVAAVLPGVRFDNRWERTDPVRVRHLLDHSAGLPDVHLHHIFSAGLTPDMALRPLFDEPAMLRVRTRPGAHFSYSNMGYTLAGAIIEAVTGERYEHWLDGNLLVPLGMADSSFAFVSQTGVHADPRLAWGHQDDLTPQAAMAIAVRPAGQFTTTAYDMGLLARFLMSDGRIGGTPFVREDLLHAMGRPVGTDAARAGLRAGYALGLSRRDRDSHVGLCHAGDIVGFHAMLCLYPEAAKSFFIAINTEGEAVDYGRFDRILTGALTLPPTPPLPAHAAPADADDWIGRYQLLESRFDLTRYADLLLGGAILRRDGNAFILDPIQGKTLRLTPAGGHLLRADGRVAASHALIRTADGAQLIGDGLRSYRRIDPIGFHARWASLILGLFGLFHLAGRAAVRTWRGGGLHAATGLAGPALLVIAGLLFPLQSFARLGDVTPASLVLMLASIAIPMTSGWQVMIALRERKGLWRIDLLAGLLVLQLCAVLAIHGLIPLLLWR
ncbi:serine hydrolase domain-containing protein [Sphingomonas colocasiae]|uniref:Beta-lactamase family protein n=1 Tax=Sphingomonas colocasiae TaxID=1848973 RepID=A0ABS7PY12_9SPHN|nr:serine hydrolase domain-containing protein [Sphingomonas colocasiae]MBY8826223.1 beta-lactamase family protein [Sphingomonas colocasiae]